MRKQNFLLAALAAIVLSVSAFTFQNKPQRWEYETFITQLSDEQLNSLGEQGWELIVVHDAPSASGGVRKKFYFKRQK
jgi:hypothetical protein